MIEEEKVKEMLTAEPTQLVSIVIYKMPKYWVQTNAD